MIEKPKPRGPVKDFDDMLQRVGSWGRFQITLMFFFFPFNLFMGYVYLSSILINFSPPHWCKIEELLNTNLTQEQRRHLAIPMDPDSMQYSKCMMYAPDWNEVISTEEFELEPNPSWPVVSCSAGWEYDIENYHRTVVSDFDWVCEQAWVPSFSQAIFFVGAIPGTLGFGYISDNYGRIPATIAANLLAMISGLATTLVSGHITYIIARLFMGFSYNMFFSVPYILTLEYVDESKRTLVGNLGLAVFLTISGVYQPWLIKYVRDWRIFSWIIFGQMIIVLAVPWVMPESSRWLQSRGKAERAVEVMKKIAKINKKEVSEEEYDFFRSLCEKEAAAQAEGRKAGFTDLFKHHNIRKITILTVILFMIISCVFDASVRNVENLDFSIYISFMVSTGLELPSDLLCLVGLTYLGRRYSACLSLGLSGLFMLLAIPFRGNMAVSAFCSMAGRFWATYAMNTGFQFTVEVMPTCLRGQGTALANIMSMVAQIASPYIVYSATIDPDLPFYLMGLLGMLGALPGLFLPETAGTNLPDTLEEAKVYGTKDKFFWIPLMNPDKRYKEAKDCESPAKLINRGNKMFKLFTGSPPSGKAKKLLKLPSKLATEPRKPSSLAAEPSKPSSLAAEPKTPSSMTTEPKTPSSMTTDNNDQSISEDSPSRLASPLCESEATTSPLEKISEN